MPTVLWAHSPDTGLEHSTSQIHFPYSTLYSWIPFSPCSAVHHTLWVTATRLS